MVSVWFWNKYAVRPLHLLGGIGLVFIMASLVAGIMTLVDFANGQGMSETAWPLLTIFLFLAGIQFFISGLMADILLKSYFENTKDTAYTVKEEFVNG